MLFRSEYVESQSLRTLLAPPVVSSSSPMAPPSTADDFVNEPHCDFSKAAGRTAMQEAFARVRGQAGRSRESAHRGLRLTGSLMESRNPAHATDVVGLVQSAATADVAAAVDLAVTAAADWGRRPAAERIAVIDRKSTRLNSSHMSESRMPSSA